MKFFGRLDPYRNLGFALDKITEQHTCEDIDECLTDLHQCDKSRVCQNDFGTYNCDRCAIGFSPDNVDGKHTCTDINEVGCQRTL